MGSAVVYQRDVRRTVREHLAVQFPADNAAANAGMIFNRHFVPSRLVAKRYFEISPRSGHAGIKPQRSALNADTQNLLYTCPIHPAGRARVPGPAASPHVWRNGVDIRTHHIRFHLVALRGGPRAGVVDGIEQR